MIWNDFSELLNCQDECCGDAAEAVPGRRHQPPDRAEGLQQGPGRQADPGQPAQREHTGEGQRGEEDRLYQRGAEEDERSAGQHAQEACRGLREDTGGPNEDAEAPGDAKQNLDKLNYYLVLQL